MANKNLFGAGGGTRSPPAADCVNEAGGRAYRFAAEHALAQCAATGCLNDAYYSTAEEQLRQVLALSEDVTPEYLARVAVYARERGFMKDMPALLCVTLAKRAPELLRAVFDRVIDGGGMLRNYVQMARSGVAGNASLGSAARRCIENWLDRKDDRGVFFNSIGDDPSMKDILRLAHPRPKSRRRAALYRWLTGRRIKTPELPDCVRGYEEWLAKRGPDGDRKGGLGKAGLPDAPFLLLMSRGLSGAEWRELVERMSWNALRINLPALSRHGVFADKALSARVAERLADKRAIRRAKVFPYQVLGSWQNACAAEDVPETVRDALGKAVDTAIGNLPTFGVGKVHILVDVSGSMSSPATGLRGTATTSVRCVDVAALMAAATLRRNPRSEVVLFNHGVAPLKINAGAPVAETAARIADKLSGGTYSAAPLIHLNRRKAVGRLVVYFSDNQSWINRPYVNVRGDPTDTMAAWEAFRQRNRGAKLACVDLQPYADTQALDRGDILNIGGFSDAVFERISVFANHADSGEHWVDSIKRIAI